MHIVKQFTVQQLHKHAYVKLENVEHCWGETEQADTGKLCH